MHSEFMEALENSPVIAAVKDDDGLKKCLETDSSIVIHGLSPKEIAIDFIHQYTKADGIISTKALLIKRASELDLYTIHRFFVIDSMAYESIFKTMRAGKPDCIEILPALMPKVIQKLCKSSPIPVIAGGMVSEKEDIMALLQAGAVSVSSTNQDTWFI